MYNHFDYVPSTVDVRRSVFKYHQRRAASAYMGYLYPAVKPIKMMPGSSISLDLACEVRSGALIAPLMTDLQCDFFSFFVPNRIVWEHWKQFLGALDDVTFNNLGSYRIPSFAFSMGQYTKGDGTDLASLNWIWNQHLACHFGIQLPQKSIVYDFDDTFYAQPAKCPQLNALPFRGYTFIWNEYFRPEQIFNPIIIGKTDNGYDGMNMDSQLEVSPSLPGNTYIVNPFVGTNASGISGGCVLMVTRAHRDLYTSCLPDPSLETLNLLAGLTAPVGVLTSGSAYTASNLGSAVVAGTYSDNQFINLKIGGSISGISGENVYADLNQALLTVNNYRETIMLQNYYDALNRAGSRYDELIRNIFHVNTSAALVDIPQLIIHKRFTIYRKEVVAQAEAVDMNGDTVQPLGSQGAYIDTVIKDNFFTCSTVEHGYLHIMYALRPSVTTYTAGIDPDFFELEKFDLYYPQFDGMGDVPRYKRELWYVYSRAQDHADNTGVFGYQEYGATYKYQRNDAVGFLDTHAKGGLKGFVIAATWNNQPVLNEYYIGCLGDFISFCDCLAITNPQLAPHFIMDIRLNGTITHPMPTYNIPGQGALL